MSRTVVALLLAVALSACASAASNAPSNGAPPEEHSMRSIDAGTSVSMRQGETVRLPDGATLKYIDVPQDSRCPPNARCIRAGDADIAFEFATAGGTVAPVKPNLPEAPSKNMGAWRLTVQDLAFGDVQPVTVRIDPAQ
jgi:hypothetical protein